MGEVQNGTQSLIGESARAGRPAIGQRLEWAGAGLQFGDDFESRRIAWMLLAAAVGHTLGEAGIDYLLIKGAVADVRGLRAPKWSADLDVLVRHENADAASIALARKGWRAAPSIRATHAVVGHAETMMHCGWPITLDLHREFPGFTGGASRAFDALWARREPLIAAGHRCWAPSTISALVIESLNALRLSPDVGSGSSNVESVSRAIESLGDNDRALLRELAEEAGAAYVLGPLLDLDRAVKRRVPSTPAELEWDLRIGGAGTVVSQAVAALYVGRGGSRLGLALGLLWPERAQLVAVYGYQGRSRWAVLGLRLRRLGRGLAQLPGAIRRTWQARSRSRTS